MTEKRSLEELLSALERDLMGIRNFVPPKWWETAALREWLQNHGVRSTAVSKMLWDAGRLAHNDDLTWLSAVHKVINENVRKNVDGWTGYEGNWIDFLAYLEAVAKVKEIEASWR